MTISPSPKSIAHSIKTWSEYEARRGISFNDRMDEAIKQIDKQKLIHRLLTGHIDNYSRLQTLRDGDNNDSIIFYHDCLQC